MTSGFPYPRKTSLELSSEWNLTKKDAASRLKHRLLIYLSLKGISCKNPQKIGNNALFVTTLAFFASPLKYNHKSESTHPNTNLNQNGCQRGEDCKSLKTYIRSKKRM